MSGIAVIVVGDDPARARAGIGIAAAAAALGRPAAILFDGPSVALLAGLAGELDTARELGVAASYCTTTLADLGLTPPAGFTGSGLIGFLASNRDAQLLTV